MVPCQATSAASSTSPLSESDPWPWFDNPADQASSHFFIGNGQGGVHDGGLEQFIDTANESWAQMAGNATYISVETEGVPEEFLTAAQINTFGHLYAWLHDVHGIPFSITDTPGNPGFITHGDGGSAWGGHTGCPGNLRRGQRPAILAIAQSLSPAQVPIMLNWKAPANIADILVWPGTAAAIVLFTDGSIYNYPGSPFYGSASGQPYFVGRVAAKLNYLPASSVAKAGYQIVATSGETYNYPGK